MIEPSATTNAPEKVPLWRNPDARAIAYQAVALLAVAGAAWYLYSNTTTNLARQSIATGFGFLDAEAGFEIGETLIDYSADDTYARALLVGALNTLKVSGLGIVLATLLGTLIGIIRLSGNWLAARLAALYIEVMQNIPVLLQLFFWYAIFYEAFPSPRQALNPFAGVFLCNRGLVFAVPADDPAHRAMLLAFLAALVAGGILHRWGRKRQARSGQPFPAIRIGISLALLLPTLAWLFGGAPTAMDVPVLRGFNFQGGVTISPEFSALLLGLVLYTAAFVAEIVRAGIQSIGRGQIEAAMAIGLRPGQTLHLVVLPQALRVIVPPLTSQMLNLIKNSSLAIAIGYADFVAVTNTTINQTGQAIEGVVLIMLVFLSFSLTTSLLMNLYNRKTTLVARTR